MLQKGDYVDVISGPENGQSGEVMGIECDGYLTVCISNGMGRAWHLHPSGVCITHQEFVAFDEEDVLRLPHAGFWEALADSEFYEGENTDE